MNKLTTFSAIFILLGMVIIGLIFFYLIPEFVLPTNLRILDFVVVCFVYLICLNVLFRPMVNLNDESQKQVAGLGLRWFTKGLYSIAALGVVIYSIVNGWSHAAPEATFRIYLIIHLILLFFFLGGMLAAFASEKKAAAIYHTEEIAKDEKKSIKLYITDMQYAAEDTPGVPDEIRSRINNLAAETRFITPSATAEARHLDQRIIDCCNNIEPALRNYEMNKEAIGQYLAQLERDFQRRRSTI